MTGPARFVHDVNDRMTRYSDSLPEAVRKTRTVSPELALQVLETIGSWPSSEPILAELQRQL